MNYFPRSINTWDKLQYFIRCINERCEAGEHFYLKVLFYNPWTDASKKIKNYDCRINLFEVPEAFHVLTKQLDFDMNINYVPTLLTLKSVETPEGFTVNAVMNDNPTAIHYELTSKG